MSEPIVARIEDELEQQRRLGEADAYVEWLFKNLEPYIGRRVLDVGCAIGNITQYFVDREHVVGIDIAQEMVDESRARFAHLPNYHGQVCDISQPESLTLKDENLDTIVCVHVLEHVVDDLAALRHMHEILPDGGNLLLVVPVVKWLYGPLDRATGHQRRYVWRELKPLLEDQGYAIRDHWYLNFLAVFGWFYTGRILRREIIPEEQYGLYNKLTPILARLETWIRPPIGLSVACVCQVIK